MDQSLKTLSDYTNPALMVPELSSKTAAGVIAELCSVLEGQGLLSDSSAFYDAVMARESLSQTVIAPGWALPHARLKWLTQLSFVLARSSQPLDWFGKGGIRPEMVFLFAVPESKAKTYLDLIAAVARLTQNVTLIEELRQATDGKMMFSILGQVPLRQWGSTSLEAAQRKHAKLDNLVS
jgi:PTS system fructose-specific IIC component